MGENGEVEMKNHQKCGGVGFGEAKVWEERREICEHESGKHGGEFGLRVEAWCSVSQFCEENYAFSDDLSEFEDSQNCQLRKETWRVTN